MFCDQRGYVSPIDVFIPQKIQMGRRVKSTNAMFFHRTADTQTYADSTRVNLNYIWTTLNTEYRIQFYCWIKTEPKMTTLVLSRATCWHVREWLVSELWHNFIWILLHTTGNIYIATKQCISYSYCLLVHQMFLPRSKPRLREDLDGQYQKPPRLVHRTGKRYRNIFKDHVR